MSHHAVMWAALSVWAALYGGSFVAFALTAPADFGFTRGLNRIAVFLAWQSLAVIPALIAWRAGRVGARSGLARWLSRCPLIAAASLALGLAGLIFWADLDRPEPAPANPPPVTRPVKPTPG